MSTSVSVTLSGRIFAGDTFIGTVQMVTCGDGGRVHEAVGTDGTKVRRFSPGGAAHALRDLMLGAPE